MELKMLLTDVEIAEIEKRIEYTFLDKQILNIAFTHASLVNEQDTECNERMEFFGDRILNFLVVEDLYFNEKRDEGVLSEKLKDRVSQEPLAACVKKLGLLQFLKTSKGSNVQNFNCKAISNLFEALLAAIYLDSKSLDKCRKFIQSKLVDDKQIDYITLFKEFTESDNLTDTEKSLTLKQEKKVLKDGKPFFTCEISLLNNKFLGSGNSKKDAEKDACKFACEFLKI